jgi:hypothetical protein
MQRKQQVGECWVCVIFFACVCVGASDSTTASDDPNFLRSLCHVRRALSWGGPRGGPGLPPPWLRTTFGSGHPGADRVQGSAPKFFFWAVFAILADFSIFSGFLN